MKKKLTHVYKTIENIAFCDDFELRDLSLLDASKENVFEITQQKTGIDWRNTLYGERNGLGFKWFSKTCEDPYVMGSVNILSLEKMSQNWNLERDDSSMKDFFILDYFADETCVGFFKGLDYLYLYRMEGEPQYLSLDLKGYIELCMEAKGFLYWQVIVRGFIDGKTVPEAKRYEKYMPTIFPDCSLEKLREVFERVKIKSE
jgi:hypothetical protein